MAAKTMSSAISAGLSTIPLYFTDTYLFSGTGKVLAQYDTQHSGEPVKAVVLDQTVMHPQGGGQPADIGCISSVANPSIKFEVLHVQKPHGANHIEHLGKYVTDSSFTDGDEVCIEIDEARRRLNARIHSAGHLLDSAVGRLGLDNLIPSKGYHFPDGPYVEYVGDVPADKRSEVIDKLNSVTEDLIKESIPTTISINDKGEREVNVGGTGCMCGGTHVKNTAEIIGLKITRIKKVKKSIKVSYFISDQE